MKTKEEVIATAYGKYWEQVKQNVSEFGWVCRDLLLIDNINDFDTESTFTANDTVRPKSLQGIEDNNGWVSINSENDLPKEGYVFWVKREGIDSPLYKSEEFFNAQINKEWLDSYTHYQPIVKPKPPIHL